MDWRSRRVLILGAGRQGTSLARYLAAKGARVVLNDRRPAGELVAVKRTLTDISLDWQPGGHPLELLDGIDLLCVSGGVPLDLPLLMEARNKGIPLSNDSQIFMEVAPCRVIGITGSAGKSTTTALVGHLARLTGEEEFQDARRRNNGGAPQGKVWVGGNIGEPLIDVVDRISADDLAVMELSSFQLEIMTRSPQIAVVLNITPNHLDRHRTMGAYTAAKARILKFQSGRDIAILGYEDPGARSLAGQVRGEMLTFGEGKPPAGLRGTFVCGEEICFQDFQVERRLMRLEGIRLPGQHNRFNVLAACVIAMAAGLPSQIIEAGIAGFEGLPHRLEFIRSWGGADWYNDSIATAPERAMAAIQAFSQRPIILLAGGRDKNLSWQTFAALVHRNVDHLIVFGEAAGKVLGALGPVSSQGRPFTVDQCMGLRDAVEVAAQLVEPGDVVLLSPGGTSFDEFQDFEDRGECYRRWVMELR